MAIPQTVPLGVPHPTSFGLTWHHAPCVCGCGTPDAHCNLSCHTWCGFHAQEALAASIDPSVESEEQQQHLQQVKQQIQR